MDSFWEDVIFTVLFIITLTNLLNIVYLEYELDAMSHAKDDIFSLTIYRFPFSRIIATSIDIIITIYGLYIVIILLQKKTHAIRKANGFLLAIIVGNLFYILALHSDYYGTDIYGSVMMGQLFPLIVALVFSLLWYWYLNSSKKVELAYNTRQDQRLKDLEIRTLQLYEYNKRRKFR